MNDLAARLEKVTDLVNQGFITIEQAKSLLGFPEICYLIDNKLMYFAENVTIEVLELE